MIRRSWLIYQRKSRQIVSTTYHRLSLAKADLRKLNDYYGSKRYVMQVTRTDGETGEIVSSYPNIDLIPLPDLERSDHG